MTRPLDDLLRDLDRRMDDDAPAVLVPVGLLRECRDIIAAKCEVDIARGRALCDVLLDPMTTAAREDGAREEREEAVKYLRTSLLYDGTEIGLLIVEALDDAADCLASGKHRPSETDAPVQVPRQVQHEED